MPFFQGKRLFDPNCNASKSLAEDQKKWIIFNKETTIQNETPLLPLLPASKPGTMTHINVHKSGMDKIDRELVKKRIQQATNGSLYNEHQIARDKILSERIEAMRVKAESLLKRQPSPLPAADNHVAKVLEDLEKTRAFDHVIVHVDMDAFYAACETLDHPEYATMPMAVGSLQMLSTANYVARQYGVVSAMPGYIGMELCPELIIVPLDFEKYQRKAAQVRQVFSRYDPEYRSMGLDEAYLNLTKYLTLSQRRVEEVVQEMRQFIQKETGLTASAGIACNKRLAKLCSNVNKPNGQFRLPADRESIMSFMAKLPIRKINGIGKVTERTLRELLGIETGADILRQLSMIYLCFSENTFTFLAEVALGLGSVDLSEHDGPRKSISVERTFSSTSDPNQLREKLRQLCDHLAQDLEDEQLCGQTLSIKIKTENFTVFTRAKTVNKWIHEADVLYQIALPLLEPEFSKESLRLMGVRLSHLSSREKVNQFGLKKYLKRDEAEDTVSILIKCPNCEKMFETENLVDVHLDECLNLGVVRELQQQGTLQSKKSKSPVKQPSATTLLISDFFRKKTS